MNVCYSVVKCLLIRLWAIFVPGWRQLDLGYTVNMILNCASKYVAGKLMAQKMIPPLPFCLLSRTMKVKWGCSPCRRQQERRQPSLLCLPNCLNSRSLPRPFRAWRPSTLVAAAINTTLRRSITRDGIHLSHAESSKRKIKAAINISSSSRLLRPGAVGWEVNSAIREDSKCVSLNVFVTL